MVDDDEILNLDDYVHTRVPDRKEMARLLDVAKGPGRSMGRFAKECGYSPVVFSRIKNQKFIDPLDKKLLLAISEHAESGIIQQQLLHKLLLANGMTEKRYSNQRIDPMLLEKQQEREDAIFNLENEIKDILTMSLFKRGYTIKHLDYIPDDYIHPMIAGYLDHELVVQISDFDTEYVSFQLYVSLPEDMADGDSPDSQDTEKNYTSEAHDLLDKTAKLFLMSYWHPESFEPVRTVLVLNDKNLYNAYIATLSGPVNPEISVILVDTKAKDVTSEWCIKRCNGKEFNPLFND